MCIRDRPRGALYHILKTYATWRREGWLSGDVDDTKGREQFESFARAVREELIEQRFMSYVKIYVPDDAEGASELKATARAMRATLASSPFEQGVTHVLRSDDSADDLVEESSMYRIVESSSAGSSAGKLEHRLHFWFYPDSYDQWYADSSISGRGKAPWSPETSDMLKRSGTSGSPHRVRARWLRDSFKFNEWMNELDYEFDVTRECLQGHRHAWDPSLEAKTKRQRDDTYEFDAESLLPEGAERMSHDVVRRRVSRAHPVVNAASSQDDGALVLMDEFEDVTKEFLAAKSLRVTNLSAGQLPASARPAQREKTNENVASLGTFRVPTYSAWFRWEDAHAVEEKALPELFTPQALDDDGRVSNGKASPSRVNKVKVECLAPGLVCLRKFLSVEQQEWFSRACFDLGETNGESGQGFFEKDAEDGTCRLNQGSRGRMILHADDFDAEGKLKALCAEAVSTSQAVDAAMPEFDATTVLVNFYKDGAEFKWHKDSEDPELVASRTGPPIVSFSVGLSADFGYKYSFEDPNHKVVRLNSGDVLLFGGPSRMIVHSVLNVYPGTMPPQ